MFVKTQNRDELINLDKYTKVALQMEWPSRCPKTWHIRADDEELAVYKDMKDAESAFSSLCLALAEGCGYFAFPKDLRPAKQEGNGENA